MSLLLLLLDFPVQMLRIFLVVLAAASASAFSVSSLLPEFLHASHTRFRPSLYEMSNHPGPIQRPSLLLPRPLRKTTDIANRRRLQTIAEPAVKIKATKIQVSID